MAICKYGPSFSNDPGHEITNIMPIFCVLAILQSMHSLLLMKKEPTGHIHKLNVYSTLVQHNLIEMTWKQG